MTHRVWNRGLVAVGQGGFEFERVCFGVFLFEILECMVMRMHCRVNNSLKIYISSQLMQLLALRLSCQKTTAKSLVMLRCIKNCLLEIKGVGFGLHGRR